MPSYAGITLTLQSQYDAATIPESEPHIFNTASTPTLRSLPLEMLTCESPGLARHPDKTFAELHQNHESATTVVETYVPIYQSSQFWVRYECAPPFTAPSPISDDSDVEELVGRNVATGVKYFFFKLVVSGKCVTSWGVGEKDRWKGKTVFGLFDGGRDFEGRRIVEKRGLFFPGRTFSDDGFEIRVFRAKARRREAVKYQSVGDVLGGGKVSGGCAIDLTSVGKAHRGEPQRSYSYALIDAKAEPWVVFRYRFEREDTITRPGSTLLSTDVEDMTTTIVSSPLKDLDATGEPSDSSLWTGLEQNTPPQPSSLAAGEDMTARRLSFPPRIPLQPASSGPEPDSPIKQQTSAFDDDLTRSRSQARSFQYTSIHFAESPRRTTGLRKPEWTVPVQPGGHSGKEKGGPSHKTGGLGSRSGTRGLLRSVVHSAGRRRGRE